MLERHWRLAAASGACSIDHRTRSATRIVTGGPWARHERGHAVAFDLQCEGMLAQGIRLRRCAPESNGAEGGIRTPTLLRAPAPQAGASASSATSASGWARAEDRIRASGRGQQPGDPTKDSPWHHAGAGRLGRPSTRGRRRRLRAPALPVSPALRVRAGGCRLRRRRLARRRASLRSTTDDAAAALPEHAEANRAQHEQHRGHRRDPRQQRRAGARAERRLAAAAAERAGDVAALPLLQQDRRAAAPGRPARRRSSADN